MTDRASGRLSVVREADPGAPTWIHRWMGDQFSHNRETSAHCLCCPYYVAADDVRTLDEIADDIEEETASVLLL